MTVQVLFYLALCVTAAQSRPRGFLFGRGQKTAHPSRWLPLFCKCKMKAQLL